METVAELRRVIRRIEASSRPARSLEDLVGGRVEETSQGPILAVRRTYDLGHRYGTLALSTALDASAEVLGLVSRRRDGTPPAPHELLYLDTETTGLAGGTGTYAFLVGVGFFEGEGFVVQQYFMRDLDEEPALLATLQALLPRFAGLVTYNGTAFDLSLLETRFVLSRRRWPADLWHLDLLRPARRLWASRLPDCRLVTLEAEVLGWARQGDVPGSLIPALYFEYLRRRHPGALPRVFDHNRQDILSLVALTGWVARAFNEPERLSLCAEEYVGLGRLWEPWNQERACQCYRTALDLGLSSPEKEWLRLRLAAFAKRGAQWADACALWEAVITEVKRFDIRPWEELAKYYEHRGRDFSTAHQIVTEALGRAECDAVSPAITDSLSYRLARLTRRLSQTTSPGPPRA